MIIFRIDSFRINFNSYQNAYFTTITKKYKFCLNLLANWIFDYLDHSNSDLQKQLDWKFRRYGYSDIINHFPQKLFTYVYKQIPSSIAQNIYPEALAIAKSRLKQSKIYHADINSDYFTWTSVPKNQNLRLPRSKSLKLRFTDAISLTIPRNVFNNIQSKKYFLRFRFYDGKWFCEIIKSITIKKQKTKNQQRTFAGIDLNLGNIAFLDQNTQQPMLFNLEQINKQTIHMLKHYDILKSKHKDIHANRKLRKIKHMYKSVLKMYAIRIIQYCKNHSVNRIAIGNVSKSFKKKQLNRFLRRLWNLIPWSYFTNYLHSYAEKFGILTYEISEAYTSKASFLSNDPLDGTRVSGKRITRGLYKDKNIIIHADVNACANILRKAAYNFDISIKINYKKLSAVRKFSYKLLNWIRLDDAVSIESSKDFLNNVGKFSEFVTNLKSRYCWSAFQNIMILLLNLV